MDHQWDSESELLYGEAKEELLSSRSQTLAALGAVLFPLFSFLDYFTQNHRFFELSLIRFSTTLIFVMSYFFIKKDILKIRPLYSTLFLFVIATFSIGWMCVVLGGFESPYYAGINLILIAAALIIPVGERQMFFYVLVVIGIYVSLMLMAGESRENDPALIVNNLYFLFATGVICLASAHITERLRREAFLRHHILERAQQSLKSEIKSSQNSIENMVEEIAARRIDLEQALQLAESATLEAQKALQVREDFISLASHELNTPLTSLKLQTELQFLKMKRDPMEAQVEAYHKIVKTYDYQLKRLVRMVEDMLNVSRIKKGKLELEKQQMDLSLLINELIEKTSKELYSHAPQITFHSCGEVIGYWDYYRIEQVILNLLTNAMKYGGGKPIEITLSQTQQEARIEVRDYGIGIPPEKREVVFEQFGRAVDTKEYTGLGLGLYLANQVVQAHGGKVHLESTLGEGSSFSVILPK